MDFKIERWRELVRAVVKGPGLGAVELARLAGISKAVLMPGYPGRPKPETMARVAAAAAELLHLEHAQLAAWLTGHAEPSISDFLRDLPNHRQCGVCRKWFRRDSPDWYEPTTRCRRCDRDRGRLAAAAASPRQQQIRAELLQGLPKIENRDPELGRVVAAVLSEPESITMPRIAARLKGRPAPRAVKARLLMALATLTTVLRLLSGGDGSTQTPRGAQVNLCASS